MKQKAKKSTEQQQPQQQPNRPNSSAAPNDAMPYFKSAPTVDPNATLVQTLLGHGFTIEQISKAQEQLWEAVGSGEGGYDDVWAVGDLLVKTYGGGSGSMDDDDDEEEDDSKEEDSEEEEEDDFELDEEVECEKEIQGGKLNIGNKFHF